jgi:hypothetical protein
LRSPKRPGRTESLSVFRLIQRWCKLQRCWRRSPNGVGAKAPTGSALGAESLPPTIALFPPKWSRGVVCALAQAPRHGPGARHATRKLMAPPLRFFVLPAFVSLGSRSAPDCLTGTIRSQGFSPSQRFNPARALRLCFTSHPPIGFLASRAFPTQPAVTPLDARCSFVVSSSSGSSGLPHRSHCPSLWSTADWRSNAVPCHETSVQLNQRRNIISFSNGRSQTGR